MIAYLKRNNISIYSAILQESKAYDSIDYKTPSAIIIGTESSGLTEEWRNDSTAKIQIPMEGKLDSMNLSVAAGILIFEAKRQRKHI